MVDPGAVANLVGERTQDEVEELLSVVMEPSDAPILAAATSEEGIIAAATARFPPIGMDHTFGERGNAPPSSRFTPEERARAAEIQQEVRAMAEIGSMVQHHERDRAIRQARFEESHPLATVMIPSARHEIRQALDGKFYRYDHFTEYYGDIPGARFWIGARDRGWQPEDEEIWGAYAKTFLEWYVHGSTTERRGKWPEHIVADARVLCQDALGMPYPGPIFENSGSVTFDWGGGPILLSPLCKSTPQ